MWQSLVLPDSAALCRFPKPQNKRFLEKALFSNSPFLFRTCVLLSCSGDTAVKSGAALPEPNCYMRLYQLKTLTHGVEYFLVASQPECRQVAKMDFFTSVVNISSRRPRSFRTALLRHFNSAPVCSSW